MRSEKVAEIVVNSGISKGGGKLGVRLSFHFHLATKSTSTHKGLLKKISNLKLKSNFLGLQFITKKFISKYVGTFF